MGDPARAETEGFFDLAAEDESGADEGCLLEEGLVVPVGRRPEGCFFGGFFFAMRAGGSHRRDRRR